MATINYLYRSTKDFSNITLRLLFSHNNKPHNFYANTKVMISKADWDIIYPKQEKGKKPKAIRDIKYKNLKTEIENELIEIEKFVLSNFNNSNIDEVNSKWFKDQVHLFYNPIEEETETEENKKPLDLISYIDYYIEYRKHELKESSIKKYNVIKHKLQRLEKQRKKPILIKDINESFRKEFENYSKANNYSQNTMQREFVFIKTFCKHARDLGLETDKNLDGLKFKREKVEKIYLTFEDLEKIEVLENKHLSDYLDNAKDWLIISCYTGQRISDFMQFDKSKIKNINGNEVIEFRQKKTQKEMAIPIHKKVKAILDKRNGNFPRPISDQKYNDYIKEVCKLANIDEVVKGKLLQETKTNNKQYRKIENEYPKWQLVSSHIGRRSFATNFYGTIPTTYLIYVTGHSSEREFLNYIGKSNTDLTMSVINYFN